MPSTPIYILAVDDDVELGSLTKQFLEMSGGLDLETAGSVREAMVKLAARRYDAIVSDYQMPDEDGIEFLKSLRKAGDSTPFILFTGKGREEVVIEALNSGADFYLQKGGDVVAQFAELEHKVRAAVARNKAEEAVREQRSRLEALIDNSDKIVFSVDTNYRYTAFNSLHRSMMKTLYGVDIELGKGQLDYQTIREDRGRVKTNLDRALKGERFVETAISGDVAHTLIEFEVEHNPIKGPDGKVSGVAVFASRLTDLRRAEEAFNVSRRRYEALFAAYNEGVALHEMIYDDESKAIDYRILEVNPAFEKMTNIPREMAVGRPATEVYGTGNDAPYLEIYSKVVQTGESMTFETYFPPLNKHFTMSVFSPAKGQFATVFMDITERKKIDQGLMDSEERYRTYVDHAMEGIFIVDEKGRYRHVNKAACDMVGYSRDELLNLTIRDLRPLENCDANEFDELKEKGTVSVDIELRKKDGFRIPVRLNAVRLPQGSLMAFCTDLTEIKQEEKALRESEERFRNLSDNGFEGIAISLDGTVVDQNKALSDILGYEPGEMTGMESMVFFTPESRKIVKEQVGLKTSEPYEVLATRKNGDVVTLRLRGREISWKGRIARLSAVQDITKQKQVEAALSESEERYRTLFDNMQEAVSLRQFVFDEKGELIDRVLLDINSAGLKVLGGHSFDEIIGKRDSEIFSPDMAAKILEDMKEMRRIGRPITEEKYYDATGRFYLTTMVPLGADKVISTSVDITERGKIEEELRESAEKFRSLAESSQDYIMRYDRQFRHTYMNPAALKVSGLTEDKIIGKTHLESGFDEKLSHFWEEKLTHVFETGKPFQTQFSWESVDGPVVLDWRLTPEFAGDGTVRSVLGVSRDITQIMKASDELLKKNEELIASNQKITTTQEELKKKMVELTRAEEALLTVNRKLNLLSSITRHDINNQTIALKGHLALLKIKNPELQLNEHLRTLDRVAGQISSMIRFTKEYEDIGVHAPIWQDVRNLVISGSLDIPLGTAKLTDEVPAGTAVFADPLIVKVFHNLIGNAVRHGGSITTIRFSIKEHDGVRAIVCEDDGEGIPVEIKGRLFSNGSGNDHGFGLFLSREILAITGITITEQGEPGMGAKFVMTLPNGGIKVVGGN